jgi:hypothetical protein
VIGVGCEGASRRRDGRRAIRSETTRTCWGGAAPKGAADWPGSIVGSMHRASLAALVTFSVAILLGGVGAWAFNPEDGVVLHSEVLWRIFGIMCEGGLFLLMGLVVVLGLFTAVRIMLALGRSGHA